MIMEVQDVNATPIAQAGGYTDNTGTSLTSASHALTGTTAGNSVFGFAVTGGDAASTAAANDATMELNAQTGAGGTSDVEMSALSAEDVAGGTVTLGITMTGASMSVVGAVEIAAV